MLNVISLVVVIGATLSLPGCFEEKPKTSDVSAGDCSHEYLSSLTDQKAREAQSAKCMTSGSYNMQAPKTF